LSTCFLPILIVISLSNCPIARCNLKLNRSNHVSQNHFSDFDDIFGDILIQRPDKNDIIVFETNFTIMWSSKGSIEHVTIALYKNERFKELLAFITDNDGEFKWEVGTHQEGLDYSIAIWDYNDFNSQDFSEQFTLSRASSVMYFKYRILWSFFLILSFLGLVILCLYLYANKLFQSC
jgi:hypothetical protein